MKICKNYKGIFLTILVIPIWFTSCIGLNNDEIFGSIIWKNNPDFRHLLVKDLFESKILESMNRAELIKILGEPEKNYPNMISYYIGKPNGFMKFPEPKFLIVEIKEDTFHKMYINHSPFLANKK